MRTLSSAGRLVAVALCAVSTQQAFATSPPEATAYQITADHAGVTTSGGVLALQEHPLWSVTLPGPISYPLIAGGGVFVTVANPVGGPSGSHLYAFDAQTGTPRFGPVDLGGTQSWSAATYDAGKLFVLTDASVLTSFNATTGAVAWSVTLGGQFATPPTASNGVIYVVGSLGLGAIDEADGSVTWQQQLPAGSGSIPTVGPNGVFLAYGCGDFANSFSYAFGGTLQWDVLPGCSNSGGSTTVYAGGRLYVTSYPNLLVLDAAAGTQQSSQVLANLLTPAVNATTSFLLASNNLVATDLASGNPLWSFNRQLSTNPIVIDQTVVVASAGNTGILYGVNALTGALTWQVQTDPLQQPAGNSAVAAADGVLVAPLSTTLFAYSLFGPPAPTAPTATGAAGAVSLTWTAPAGATGTYNVYQGSSAGFEDVTPVLTGISGTTASVTGLTTGPTYYFTVKSVTAAGISAASPEASAASHDPAPPGTLTGTPGLLSVTLHWQPSADAPSYNVYMSANNPAIDFSKDLADLALTGTSATFQGLDPSVTYYFAVKSNAYGVALSGASNQVAVMPTAPPPPTGLTATAASGSVSLNWAAVAGANAYELFMATAPGAEPAGPVQGNITGTSATVSGLTDGTTYYFVVRTIMDGFAGGPSSEVSATPPALPPTQPPAGGGGGGGSWDPMSLLVVLASLAAASGRRTLPRSRAHQNTV